MAKILYGVSGEGSGHSSRARLISEFLISEGHQVKIASYDRGYRNLKDDFDVLEIVGLTIVSEDNEVSRLKTIAANLSKIPSGKRALDELRALIKSFQPDCILCDFEPCTAYLATHYSIPLVSIDNQHRMRYMDYQILSELKKDAFITESIIRTMVPKPWVSLITTFHQGTPKNDHSFLFPPILRSQVLELQPRDEGYILVYTTSGFDSLLETLKDFGREKFLVYGYNKDEVDNNIHFRPFSADGFLQDLAACKAVIATAGFTLICEALYLGKPYLAFPMQGQFEQQLNAFMLAKESYGAGCAAPSYADIAAFLYGLPDYKKKLASYEHSGNTKIQEYLRRLLADDLALLKRYRPE
ncbi:MJ1255/VC2487 family glycosyltransferase [Teredinibacter haidensis]|uniref:MJ1255/VC2487 family glycosyltransferase n=1 Tax=Teredinibacter haidensis TaxID=2731755 RepID=UPI000948A410|nr:MJ1255/VC2487 family glycosyltransferase [Teredinibacter haidensis]